MPLVRDFKELRTYRLAFDAAMRIFEISKNWPKDERYSLTDQIRRSSRSVCSNIGEAWRKRLYVANFVSRLSDANAEAAETQVWLDFALKCNYIDSTLHSELYKHYEQISGGLIKMIAEPDAWCGPAAVREEGAEYNVSLTGDPDLSDETGT
ncbi:MAG: four helix bundle protein [Chloroflexi bacterium RBG_16_63_12]|jgi:four helix bundle protein|nr:MAG: four helix bundle protein [Chloroflexi bacterium RBG_16_63_12]